ncbi:MAG: zinc ribbon domain-containing protein [bacterium]
MTTTLIFGFLSLLVSFFVILPFLQARWRKGSSHALRTNQRASDLVDRKHALYAAIKDIEFDFQMGKLSEEDFQELRQQYKNQAVNILKKIDQRQRKKMRAGGRHAKKEKSRTGTQKGMNFCWSCGTRLGAEEKFCPNCGLHLRQG